MNRGPHVTVAFPGRFAAGVAEGRTGRHPARGHHRRGHAGERAAEPRVRVAAEGFRDAEVRYDREAHGPDDDADCLQDPARARSTAWRGSTSPATSTCPTAVLQPLLRLAPGQWFVKSRSRPTSRRSPSATGAMDPRGRQGAAARHRGRAPGQPRCPADGDRGDEDRVESVEFSGHRRSTETPCARRPGRARERRTTSRRSTPTVTRCCSRTSTAVTSWRRWTFSRPSRQTRTGHRPALRHLRGAADSGRSRPGRRQRADQDGDDRARGRAGARDAAVDRSSWRRRRPG